MLPSPSPEEFAEEIRRALEAAPKMTPLEHFEFLIKEGIIDRQGRVICNRLFGGQDDQTEKPDPSANGSADQTATEQAEQKSGS
jgi:hypothetical protein